MRKLENFNIILKQNRDDADVLIIETAIEETYIKKIIIVGEDIDFLVLLIVHTNKKKTIFLSKTR